MKPAPTDLELVRGLQARSAAAFSRVYDDYHAGIYNLCARILDDREEARDVTQDVFIKAFSSPPEAVGEVKLRAWLYRVATEAAAPAAGSPRQTTYRPRATRTSKRSRWRSSSSLWGG
jgi:DNA-directed RNA polymerase specialized sigma24 family protein